MTRTVDPSRPPKSDPVPLPDMPHYTHRDQNGNYIEDYHLCGCRPAQPERCGCQCHGSYVWDVCPHCRPDLLAVDYDRIMQAHQNRLRQAEKDQL